MRPFGPNSIGFEIPTRQVIPYANTDLSIPITKKDHSFSPDKVAFRDLLVPFYANFSYASDTIPFYNREQETFNFPR